MTVAIAVDGLGFEYPGVRALEGVSFAIGRGSVTALVGPNGAGKTTLLRCVAGLDRPLLGTIEVAGIDVLEEPRVAHRRMGYLSDFYGLYDALSVRRVLSHAAAAHGVEGGAIADTVERTAQRLEIGNLLERRCAELSRGQRQRVAIGRALVHAPELLLLDEPAAGLDPEARHLLARLFTRLREEGMTLLVSSHILAELNEYSTHMLVLQGGRVVEHRALAGADAGESSRLRIGFAQSVADLAARLEAIEGVLVLESSGDRALVAVAGGLEAQAMLLRTLVERGLPVASFAEERENLHESYLRTVRAAGEAR